MGYRMSKQNCVGYSPYFLLYGREQLFPFSIQHLGDVNDSQQEGPPKLKLQLTHRGAVVHDIISLVMRNLTMAQ